MDININFSSLTGVRNLLHALYAQIVAKDLEIEAQKKTIAEQQKKLDSYERQDSRHTRTTLDKPPVLN